MHRSKRTTYLSRSAPRKASLMGGPGGSEAVTRRVHSAGPQAAQVVAVVAGLRVPVSSSHVRGNKVIQQALSLHLLLASHAACVCSTRPSESQCPLCKTGTANP